jgi:hypothetical protein
MFNFDTTMTSACTVTDGKLFRICCWRVTDQTIKPIQHNAAHLQHCPAAAEAHRAAHIAMFNS